MEFELLAGSFDTTYALSGMYMWLMFSFLSNMINCDLQRWMKDNQIVRHVVGIISFFFLFTLIDSNNKSSVYITILKTFFVYAIFLLATKSKWYFAVPVLALLLIDQAIKKQKAYLLDQASRPKKDEVSQETDGDAATTTTTTSPEVNTTLFELTTNVINVIVIVVIILGAIHYLYLQYLEYGPQGSFSLSKFLFKTGTCKPIAST